MVSRLLITTVLILFIGCGGTDKRLAGSDKDQLSGSAEDLWGNRIELADYAEGVTIISPFSPATCGYCLIDGHFVEANYHQKTRSTGGHDFYQALFVPQIDIYSFLKHYRVDGATTLTYPLTLQRYQEDGFPYMIGFADGRKTFAEVISHYDADYRQFVHTMWPNDTDVTVTLTSPRKLAENFMYEDTNMPLTYVVPDGIQGRYADLKERFAGKENVRVALESKLTRSDLRNNLIYEGWVHQFTFDEFADRPTPVRFDSVNVYFGGYKFAKPDVGIVAIFPNPYNPERYVSLRLSEKHTGMLIPELWSDFSVWRYKSPQQAAELLLDGVFEKQPGNVWRFADSLTVSYTNLTSYCKGGVCPLPPSAFRDQVRHEFMPNATVWESTAQGAMMTLGDAACRFPAIAAGSDGSTAIIWEERGDIFLAMLHADEPPSVLAVEHSSFDSFNPKIVRINDGFFVAYLSNKDGWYRMYGRYVDGNKLSPEMLVSEMSSFDVITPSLATDGKGRIVAAWSEWRANSRHLSYRYIDNRTPGPVQLLQTVTEGTDDYTNAWYPSLAFDADGSLAGAWNQHYPATLGVCAGNLTSFASSVTAINGDISRNECGGYPSTAFDADNRQWVVRETYWWNTYKTGDDQQILAARLDPNSSQWSTPYVVSSGKTHLNQSPSMVADKDGRLWVAWSGRTDSRESTWGIYLAHFDGSKWSDPVMVSTGEVCSRAPQVAVDDHNQVWVTWHSGVGQDMKIKVLRYSPTNL